MTYASIFSARIVNIWNSLPNSIVDAGTVMHLKHGSISFGRTKQLNMILQLTWSEPETDQKKF